MPRVRRLFLAATLSTLAALLPVTAFASDLSRYVVGAQYAVGEPCTDGTTIGTISSFAGFGSTTRGGRANAVFNTSICHTEIKSTGAAIIPGGSFQLSTGSLTLVGQYAYGLVKPGTVSGRNPFCKEVFEVGATLAPATSVPLGTTNISSGTAGGLLTHYGLRTADGGCHAYAAAIAGTATLVY